MICGTFRPSENATAQLPLIDNRKRRMTTKMMVQTLYQRKKETAHLAPLFKINLILRLLVKFHKGSPHPAVRSNLLNRSIVSSLAKGLDKPTYSTRLMRWNDMQRYCCIPILGSFTNHEHKCQSGCSRCSRQAKFSPKQSSRTQDITEERPLKKRRLASFGGEEDTRSVQDEIAGIKEDLENFAAEAREDRRALRRLLNEIEQKLQTSAHQIE
jgi:hypothetical protein